MYRYLKDTVAVAGVAEVLEAEVALAFRELVTEGLLKQSGSSLQPTRPPPWAIAPDLPS